MLTAEDVRTLERLSLTAPAAAHAGGARQAGVRGAGLEFQDYRPYEPGDDLRRIDWTVEARLRHLVVRVTESEGHLPLHVLVDTSASMAIGAPAKHACATRLAAALCYVAAARRDPLGITLVDDRVRTHLPSVPGRAQLFRVLDVLRAAEARGASDLSRSLEQYDAVARGPGVLVIVSDFLGNARLDAIAGLRRMRQTPVLVQVLADEDLEPSLDEATQLVDIESPSSPPLVLDGGAASTYRARIRETVEAFEATCRAHGVAVVRLRSSSSFSDAIGACVRARVLAVR